MWDCPKCGTLGIMGLEHCPTCGAPREEGYVAASVLPAEDVSAAPADEAGTSGSLAGEDEKTAAADEPEPQAPKKTDKK